MDDCHALGDQVTALGYDSPCGWVQSSAAATDPRPPSRMDVQAVANGFQEVGQCKLNAEQRLAVASVMSRAGADMPFALFGPPGTGKTVTLVECALQVRQRCSDLQDFQMPD